MCSYFSVQPRLRYSDVNALKWSNISERGITVTAQKTFSEVFIPFNNLSKLIIAKYRELQTEDMVFPELSNQKACDNLKSITKLCELTRTISRPYFVGSERIEKVSRLCDIIGTHSGRATFICRMLSHGVPVHSVMGMTGHKSLKKLSTLY